MHVHTNGHHPNPNPTEDEVFDLRALFGVDVDPIPVEHLNPHQLRWALTLAREEIAAHVTKWHEIEASFGDDVACTPGCLGSRLIPPCEECDEEDQDDEDVELPEPLSPATATTDRGDRT
ncbi:hypothetical protein [Embleya sp. NPDC020630]|uniref:hypothetical protein n=1 Tax=Embleya sp. NPDC020630 TaxID=3363979 RepID=UPI0037A1C385